MRRSFQWLFPMLGVGSGGASSDVERDDRPEAFQLAARRVVRRVARQARVARDQHLRMISQALRQHHRVLLRALQPDRQRSRAPDSKKRFQRAGCSAGQLARCGASKRSPKRQCSANNVAGSIDSS